MAVQNATAAAAPTTAQALEEQREQNEAAQQQRVKKTADTTRTTGTVIGIVGDIGGSIVGAYNPAAGEAVKEVCKYGEQAASIAADSYEAANAEDGQEAAAWSGVATETLTAAYGASQETSAFSAEGQAGAYNSAAKDAGGKAALKEEQVNSLKEKNPSILSSDGSVDTSTSKGKQAYRAAARADTLRAKQSSYSAKANELSPK